MDDDIADVKVGIRIYRIGEFTELFVGIRIYRIGEFSELFVGIRIYRMGEFSEWGLDSTIPFIARQSIL